MFQDVHKLQLLRSLVYFITVRLENGLAGSCDSGADPLQTMLDAAKWHGSSIPWKVTKVFLDNFDAKEGFNFAEEILAFLALFTSGILARLVLFRFHGNALVSITGFFKKLPDLESFWVSSYAKSGGFSVCLLEGWIPW